MDRSEYEISNITSGRYGAAVLRRSDIYVLAESCLLNTDSVWTYKADLIRSTI